MKKIIACSTIILVALLFIAGCTETETATPVSEQNKQIKAVETTSNITEPNLTISENDVQTEENSAKPEDIEPAAPADTEPTAVKTEPVADTNEPPVQNLQDPNLTAIDVNDVNTPSEKVVFHDYCAEIFTNFVSPQGNVNYSSLKNNRLKLITLLNKFENLDPGKYKSWSKEDKIAFWINAYNIKLLRNIVDNYPLEPTIAGKIIWGPKSIRNIPPTEKIGIAKWENYKFLVMNEEFTLPMIEKKLFSKEFGDQRVNFALSSAAVGGPLLRNEPYYGHKLDQQLQDQVTKFFNSKYGLRINKENQKVSLYAPLKWLGTDFVPKYGTDKKFKDKEPDARAVLNFIANYLSNADKSYLETQNYTIDYIAYNWTLNE